MRKRDEPRPIESEPALLPLRLPESAPGPPEDDPEPPRSLFSTLYMVGIVFFGVCLAKLYLDQYIEIRRLRADRVRARQEMTRVKERQERMAEEVEYLETLEGVERLARDKLRYIRPDEVIVVPLRPE